MMTTVYFDRDTGEITGHATVADSLIEFPNSDSIVVDRAPDPRREVVDVVERQVVARTSAPLPSEVELRQARAMELRNSDWTDAAPHLTSEQRAAWQAYRQALRDITTAGDVSAMVAAWPDRPDGSSAVAALRERI